MKQKIDYELILTALQDYRKWFDDEEGQAKQIDRQIDLIEKTRGACLVLAACSDGDCIFQCDETCHRQAIRIDDSHQCISRETENKRGDEM